MVFALAGDSTTTRVLPLARETTSPSPAAFLLVLRALVAFAVALLVAIVPRGGDRCRHSQLGSISSAAQEIFPGPSYRHPLQLQLGQFAERFPGWDLRTQGEVVYMSRGPAVQQLPQLDTRLVDHGPIWILPSQAVGCRDPETRCVVPLWLGGNRPAHRPKDLRRADRRPRLLALEEGVRALGPPAWIARNGEDRLALHDGLPRGDQRARLRGGAHHHHGLRQPRHDPVAAGEISRNGLGAGRELGQDRAAAVRQTLEERAVLGRIRDVDAAPELRDGSALRPERALVRSGVDAARSAGDDLDAGAGQGVAEVTREIHPRLVGVAGADHRHSPDFRRDLAADVEHLGRTPDRAQRPRVLDVPRQQ